MRNFANPYFSRNFTEFWERWHISLSTWFRDYVYIPLGGNRLGEGRRKLNLILTFAVSGLWHGANWTFVVWGLLHAYFVLGFGRERGAARESFPATARDLPRIFVVFTLTCFAWIFFWSPSFEAAVDNLSRMFAGADPIETIALLVPYLIFIVPFVMAEWFSQTKQHPLEIESLPVWGRWLIYAACLWVIFIIGNLDAPGDFIYFQF
jgi:alginate O-acetyltransferase complex protein AlgI